MQHILGSQILFDSTPQEGNPDYWRALFYLNIYRMLLSVFLVTASLATINIGSLGSRHPELFFYASSFYAASSIIFIVLIHKGWPTYVAQCRFQLILDILIIILLYHASAGRGAGLEILLFISVSASGILLGGRGALAAASIATISLILEHAYVILSNQRTLGGFTTLALIGSGLFITAIIIYYLSLLLRTKEKQVAKQNLDLQKLSHLNELIVEQLKSGVLVVDKKLKLILINQSGRKLLNIFDEDPLHQKLKDLLPELSKKIKREGPNITGELKLKLNAGNLFLAHYTPLDKTPDSGYMIMLEDFSRIEKAQRDEKFMAMGRLSASIAHEIRNPLGAISHAGQLLSESPSIVNNDNRLVEIIEHQSQRINRIIQTILELGQPNDQTLQNFALHKWLTKIVNNFIIENNLDKKSIQVIGNKSISACGDPEQLQHVIVNLLSNAICYANDQVTPIAVLEVNNDKSETTNSISVSDNGPRIAENLRENIFDPFFTTSSTGNGLGLYIARKICLGNHGYLDYFTSVGNKGYFKVTLAKSNTYRHSTANR